MGAFFPFFELNSTVRLIQRFLQSIVQSKLLQQNNVSELDDGREATASPGQRSSRILVLHELLAKAALHTNNSGQGSQATRPLERGFSPTRQICPTGIFQPMRAECISPEDGLSWFAEESKIARKVNCNAVVN